MSLNSSAFASQVHQNSSDAADDSRSSILHSADWSGRHQTCTTNAANNFPNASTLHTARAAQRRPIK